MKKSITFGSLIILTLSSFALFVLCPTLAFALAYLGGLVLQLVAGNVIANGLNLIFNTTRFTPNMIPLACATLAIIGHYFKSSQVNGNGKG
jgi:hypothetical protein